MIILDLMEPKWQTSTCTWKQKQFKISTGLWSGSSLDFKTIKDAEDILQQKFQLVTPPKFTRASDCLADGMATDPSGRHCELMGSKGSKGGIASQSSY